MSRSDRVRQAMDDLNARDFVAAGKDFADDVSFHAPGLGLDIEGRDTVQQHISEFVQQADVRYDLEDVVEHGPFTVAFARATGTLNGQPMTWQLCQVLRYEGEQIVETWVLRGGAPQPV